MTEEVKTDAQKETDSVDKSAPRTHPLRVQALELCWAIEELPASEKQTEVSQKATELQLAVQAFLNANETPYAEKAQSEQRPCWAFERLPASEKQNEERRERMLKWFEYSHLPEHLQSVSKPFGDLAATLCDTVQGGPERTVALRKLLEAKDAAVRAKLNPGG